MNNLPPAVIKIETAKLKPIRCKGEPCDSPIIGFAHDGNLLLSDSRPNQHILITGDDLTFAAGARRNHAKAVRYLARHKQDRAMMLCVDKPEFEDARLDLYKGLHLIFGYIKKTDGRGILITCDGCATKRKIRGIDLLISTKLVDILLDQMNFKR